MKLSHKIIVGFAVLVLLTGVYGTLVQFKSLDKISAAIPSPTAEVRAAIGQARSNALVIGALSVILGTLITFVLIKQVLTPIKAATLALEEHLKTGKAVSVRVASPDELGVMTLYLNELLKEPRSKKEKG